MAGTMAANFARAQAQKGRPDADVLWNNDPIHLIGKKMGLYDKLDPGRVGDVSRGRAGWAQFSEHARQLLRAWSRNDPDP